MMVFLSCILVKRSRELVAYSRQRCFLALQGVVPFAHVGCIAASALPCWRRSVRRSGAGWWCIVVLSSFLLVVCWFTIESPSVLGAGWCDSVPCCCNVPLHRQER